MSSILGIDPGSTHTGYGIVSLGEGQPVYVASGTITIPKGLALARRLALIYEGLHQVVTKWCPKECAVEQVFLAKNVRSALVLGQVRGVALLAGVNEGLEIYEYSPLQIKQAVVGYGKASKIQVIKMVKHILNIESDLNTHEADALAVAVCHLNTRLSQKRWSLAKIQ